MVSCASHLAGEKSSDISLELDRDIIHQNRVSSFFELERFFSVEGVVSTLTICSEGLLTYLRIEARSRGIDRPITSVPLLPTSPGRGRAETTHPADQRAVWRDPQIARATRRKLLGIAGSQTKTTKLGKGFDSLCAFSASYCCSVGKLHIKLGLFARYSKTSCPARR